MHARIGRISFSPDKADELVSHARETIVPNYESSEGFKGFTLLLDRSSGEGIGITFRESEEAMRQRTAWPTRHGREPLMLAPVAIKEWSASRSRSTRWRSAPSRTLQSDLPLRRIRSGKRWCYGA